jgi:hypothetical protein
MPQFSPRSLDAQSQGQNRYVERVYVTARNAEVFFLSGVPTKAYRFPVTTLFRWSDFHGIPWIEAKAMYEDGRLPAAFEHRVSNRDHERRRILIRLDQGIIDRQGLLAAVRSVRVLPPKDQRVKPKPEL